MASKITHISRQVKPILSLNHLEARRRVLGLYKNLQKEVPAIKFRYKLPASQQQLRQKVREAFEKNKHVTDLRAIDMLIIKGEMQHQEFYEGWTMEHHVMNHFKETEIPKPTDFLSKFLTGHDP